LASRGESTHAEVHGDFKTYTQINVLGFGPHGALLDSKVIVRSNCNAKGNDSTTGGPTNEPKKSWEKQPA